MYIYMRFIREVVMIFKKLFAIGFVAVVLVACSGNAESGAVTGFDEDFSSSVCEDCDGSSSSSKDVILSGDSREESSESKSSSSSGVIASDATQSSDAKSDSSSLSSSSSDASEGVVTGAMTDKRDGQTYKTVAIGKQVWMAENLNYAYTDVPYKFVDNESKEYSSDSTSWCYDNVPANCTKYGRLYTWAAAMDSVGSWSTNGKGCGYGTKCSPTYPVRGICPEGWHLPDTTEWHTLFTAVGGESTACKMLKSTSGWNNSNGNGTDAYAFSALPAGDRGGSGSYYDEGSYAYFWSSTEYVVYYGSTEYSSYGAYYFAFFMRLAYNHDDGYQDLYNKSEAFSVRCLKD